MFFLSNVVSRTYFQFVSLRAGDFASSWGEVSVSLFPPNVSVELPPPFQKKQLRERFWREDHIGHGDVRQLLAGFIK